MYRIFAAFANPFTGIRYSERISELYELKMREITGNIPGK